MAEVSAIVPATVLERGRRLQTKAGQGRPTHRIKRLQTSGAAVIKAKPVRTAFAKGAEGDRQWAASTRAAAAGFALATRQASTDAEHVDYMLEWSELMEVRTSAHAHVHWCG